MKVCLRLCAAALILAAGLAQAHDYTLGQLTIHHPWARPTPPGAPTGGAYFIIDNGGEADRLLAASADVADKVELHIHLHENGMMKMRPVAAVEVPARGQIKLAPGGLHVMFIGLKQSFKQGERFPLTLKFERAGEVQVEVVVEQGNGQGEQPHQGHGG
ncbi:MAG TPA: copper chaperone PCu(A)C [Candidatus Competibacteraceae bacterium]|nr:copper chaperone PCu(A)C [Candidatus Competibacteraceae bacterium]